MKDKVDTITILQDNTQECRQRQTITEYEDQKKCNIWMKEEILGQKKQRNPIHKNQLKRSNGSHKINE